MKLFQKKVKRIRKNISQSEAQCATLNEERGVDNG